MDNTTKILGGALLLMLAVFPLTAIGTSNDAPALWWVGLAVLAVACVIPPALRFVGDDGDADNADADNADHEHEEHQ